MDFIFFQLINQFAGKSGLFDGLMVGLIIFRNLAGSLKVQVFGKSQLVEIEMMDCRAIFKD